MNYKPDYDTEIRTSTSIVQHRTMHIDKIDWEYPFEDPTHFST